METPIKLERDLDVLKSNLKEFANRGYTQIRIPGGTSKSEDHYAGAFTMHYDKQTKQLYFLGVPYNPEYYKKQGHQDHEKKDCPPQFTAVRETYEETGLISEPEDLILVFKYDVIDRNDATKKHTRYFYTLIKFSGSVSDFGYGPNLIDPETSTPVWIPAELFKMVLYKGHQEAFKKVIDSLKGKSVDFYYALEKM